MGILFFALLECAFDQRQPPTLTKGVSMNSWVECKGIFVVPPCPKCGEQQPPLLAEYAGRNTMHCFTCEHEYPGAYEFKALEEES